MRCKQCGEKEGLATIHTKAWTEVYCIECIGMMNNSGRFQVTPHTPGTGKMVDLPAKKLGGHKLFSTVWG